MAFPIDVRLANETDDDVEVVIPRGTVFEGIPARPHPQQNLAALRDYAITLGPRMEVTMHLEGQCINSPFPVPRNWPMRPTVFVMP